MKLGCPTEPHLLSLEGGDVTLAGYPLERACLRLGKCPHKMGQGPAVKAQLSDFFFLPCSRVQWGHRMGTDTQEGEVHSGCCVTGIQAQ